MARVPFVGRLHLYLPQFPTKSFPYFHYPSSISKSLEATALGDDVPTLPPTPPASEPEKELQEIEPREYEEEDPSIEDISTCSSSLWRRKRSDAYIEEDSTANVKPFMEKNSQEYLALAFSFLFLVIEGILRVITIALPAPVINFFYQKSRSLFNSCSAKQYTTVESSSKEKNIVAKVRDADGFVDLCELWNDGSYRIEEHVVQTGDGYLLGLHRIVKKTEEEVNRVHSRVRAGRGGEGSVRGNGGKKVVYLHHGLLMNSEVWVCLLDKEQCLPFVLAEKGYDVWLGNNRGNKYSKKSIHHSSNSAKFWDFSIDDFAFHDIPDSINYILETTDQPSLSYIGFSQGTAQAFATLSIHPKLNDKIDVFIALAPAMSPAGLSNTIVDALMKSSPNLMYLFFGRKSILSSTTFWQSILYPPIFVRVIDLAMDFLFEWKCSNIPLNQKLAAYTHLYSYTSVKSVVHWFQIIRNRSFQMYDDDIQTGITASFSNRSFYKVAKFPTRNITAPIVLVYGGCDSLVDIKVMLKELPPHTIARRVDHFEHLDFLWGHDVEKIIFPHVLDALAKYSCDLEEELAAPTADRTETNQEKITEILTEEPLQVESGLEEVAQHPAYSLPTYSEDEAQADVTTSAVEIPTPNPEFDSETESEDTPEDVPEDLSEVLPEVIPEVIREALPEAIPEVVPEALPEVIPEVVPEEDVPEEIAPEEIAPEEIAPEEIAPEEIAPEVITSEVIIPEEMIPAEVIPEEVIPEEVIPEEVIPEEVVHELISESTPETEYRVTTPPTISSPTPLPTPPAPSPPEVTSKEEAPVELPITPPSLSASMHAISPPTRPASRSPPRGPSLGRSLFSSPSSVHSMSNGGARVGSPLARSTTPSQMQYRSTPSTPSGLSYPPPRGPAAQTGVALTYGSRPVTPITHNHKRRESFGSNRSSGSINGGGWIGNGGISLGSGRPISGVTSASVISEQNHAGLVPDAALYPSTPPPSAPFSPPTGPAADRTPPTGPRNPGHSQRRYSGSPNSPGSNRLPENGEYSPNSSRGKNKGRRGGRGRVRPNIGGRGGGVVGPGSPGSPGNFRGNGEIRMFGAEGGSLYSDNISNHSGSGYHPW
ncbi:alpha/beta-hydrolase [Wilcoxina mikolae CBS 423.85]|nr:alpha/beta-hydrolase [Wilcoxina mikolae CBS 423.85]